MLIVVPYILIAIIEVQALGKSDILLIGGLLALLVIHLKVMQLAVVHILVGLEDQRQSLLQHTFILCGANRHQRIQQHIPIHSIKEILHLHTIHISKPLRKYIITIHFLTIGMVHLRLHIHPYLVRQHHEVDIHLWDGLHHHRARVLVGLQDLKHLHPIPLGMRYGEEHIILAVQDQHLVMGAQSH